VVAVQFDLGSLRKKKPLIGADGVSLICADQRTKGGAHQRLIRLGKTNCIVTFNFCSC